MRKLLILLVVAPLLAGCVTLASAYDRVCSDPQLSHAALAIAEARAFTINDENVRARALDAIEVSRALLQTCELRGVLPYAPG